MCGIVGIVSNYQGIISNLINCLKKLEYRGYDSVGISTIENNNIITIKSCGKVSELENKINNCNSISNIGIGHTRWATHGKPSEINSHPHISENNFVSVVHNGIIENYKEIKEFLQKEGFVLKSETDTEVIPNLIDYFFRKENDYKKAILEAIKELRGSYSLGIIFRDNEKEIFAVKNGSPLIIGLGNNENYIASSVSAFSNLTKRIINLNDGDFAKISNDKYEIYNNLNEILNRDIEIIEDENSLTDMGEFDSFMLKEIYEQPKVLKRIINEYIDKDKINFPNFAFDINKIEMITIVACGTSYYAGCCAKYFFEEYLNIPVNVDISSEFRYRKPPMKENGISLFISQSGETADTVAALKYSKSFGQNIVSLVNVTNSIIANLSDTVIKTLAGIEVGVASTKAFIAQISILYLFALELAYRKGNIELNELKNKVTEFKKLPNLLESQLCNDKVDNISNIAKLIVDRKFMMYIGRGVYYPIALEGALKLKEISYIPTDGIAAGELKHGPIALIDKNISVISINPYGGDHELFEKTNSAIEQIQAREGNIILVSDKIGLEKSVIDKQVCIEIESDVSKNIQAILCLIPVQLIAYFTALYKGNNIDKPRNLAKSVTVE